MTSPSPETVEREKDEPLFVTDYEMLDRLRVPPADKERVLRTLKEHVGFPAHSEMFPEHRDWPAVKAFVDRYRLLQPRRQMERRKPTIFYTKERAINYLKITSDHWDALIEAGDLPKGREIRGRLQWNFEAIKDGMDHGGTIYFVEMQEFIKIGFSSWLTERLKAFKTTYPYDVTLLHSIAGTVRMEIVLHQRFAHLRWRGEWFRKAPDLFAYIEQLKVNP